MNLDRIPANTPVDIPSRAAKTYPDVFITDFRIGYNGDGTQPATVTFRGYNYDTKEIAPEKTRNIVQIKNIWTQVSRSPVVADALGRLVNAISLLYRERNLREQLRRTDAGIDRDRLITRFNNVQTLLGINPLEDPPPFVP